MTNQERLIAELKNCQNAFFLSGAGISVASGISPFRGSDPDAVWNKDVTEKGTFTYFREDVLGSWTWYLDRFSSLFDKAPNPAHFAVAEIAAWFSERNKKCTIATQNIDGLHRVRSDLDVIEIHGTAQRVRCATTGCADGEPFGSLPFPKDQIEMFRNDPQLKNIPRCQCGDFLRPHVLWFDETYDAHQDYRYEEFLSRLYDAELCLCVGTSFSVGITATVVRYCYLYDIPLYILDPKEPEAFFAHWIQGKAEIILPKIINALPG